MSENTENMVAVGLDPSGIRGDLKEIQNYLNRNPVNLNFSINNDSLKKTLDELTRQINNSLNIDLSSAINNQLNSSAQINKNLTPPILSDLNLILDTTSLINEMSKSSGRIKICCFILKVFQKYATGKFSSDVYELCPYA